MLELKPTHKVVTEYYQAMDKMRETGQTHETAVAPYFANILRHCAAKTQRLDLVEQFSVKREGRKPLRADGGLVDRDLHFFLYGLWEAKDSHDDLDKEINKKIGEDGYPNDNILFQSPERIVLYQHGVLEFDKSIVEDKQALIEGLDLFFSYNNKLHTEWAEVVEHFQGKVGDLGAALVKIIENELKESEMFKDAFNNFLKECQETINPNIAHAAVVEMLVQHLLTERLFRTVFDNPDFVQKNVIAREIEKVIEVLAQRSFNRAEFLFGVERFYTVIEKTAAAVHNYDDKQTFLNVVYERFFQGFAVKVADTHGIVYTPQEIVSFMVQSVEDILKVEFDKSLSSEGVHVLDPFVGTGNFILRVMEQIDLLKLENKYKNELHCNEVLLLPYYIASMNIEHTFFEKMGYYKPFEGICLVDTFEILEAKQKSFSGFSLENSQRVEKQQKTPLFVIIGNPPYNVGQINENDNNKNRKYKTVDDLVSDSYAKDSKATNKNALSDVYVKAFAWATERLKNQADGVVAFVTNNSFLENLAFDGMRKQLAAEFDKIYVLDLGGNVRKNPKLSGTKNNVFGIQVGVSVIFLIKKGSHKK